MTHRERGSREIVSVQAEVNQFVEQMAIGSRWVSNMHYSHQRAWKPPTDVFESDEAIVVVVEVSGMRGQDFSVMFADDVLTINGTRHAPEQTTNRVYQQMEICYGDFISQVHIPWAIDSENIQAQYAGGFLTITLPRKNRPTKHVPVTTVVL
ncbi:MAG: Hsp20/alpha crystallin family protein [Chloroflexi bacterium]|nr:Hsp20/alpha crystallin family protein [Chloroflexota bacterium]